MKISHWGAGVAGAVLSLAVAGAAAAQSPASSTQGNDDTTAAPGSEPSPPADDEAPKLPWQVGPTKLELDHAVQLELPQGYQFLGQPEAGQVMTKIGNLYNDNLLGLVVPSNEDEYFVTLRYDEEGFIKDDDEVDGDEILKAMQDGEDEYNEERKKAGFSPLHAAGWVQSPAYDKGSHHLIWGLIVASPEGESINYNTRVLGRRGYVSVNLVTDKEHLIHDKAAASALLAATSFAAGSTYADFDSSTDKIAEYGLTGLILGGAGLGLAKVAKIGLLAKFGKVILAGLLAAKKAIAVAAVALIAWLKKLFGRKPTTAA